ncbi:kinase-like domain-containing protein [Lentinula aciculospora]|uniref:Kinase-like domain-containing protein n=1 Tax=Lentinula aciculospora TaxID=153920 RepID=A0A9W9ATW0_9AGAR|nr:kinase-like domain-containing protein [Lentinula aciculospora]
MPASTVPCQYRTGRTLGSGTYAIVKEAIHIKTGKYYACKVINKKLMEGREHMVRNEIAVLKRISSGNRNVVTLHDYFETAHNLYLCFDLCTGGELFDRICAKGNYYEGDAASLVRTILTAVSYIHSAGIVHRDLKPENLLFRTPAEDADIMIADFGLSRVMEGGIGGDKLNLLTEICGTPGYMAPEIFKKTGHGKPVDVWAMGVITYFLLAGYTPFDRDSQQAEMEAIIAGDYKFEPHEYWVNVSQTAREFIRWCLTIDSNQRPTADECLGHKWLASATPHFVPDPESPTGGPTDLLPHVKKAFNAKGLWRKAAFSIRALNRMTMLAGSGYTFSNNHAEAQRLRADVATYKEESEKEKMEDASITHQHESDSNPSSPASPTHSRHMSAKDAYTEGQKAAVKKQDDISVDNENDQSLETMMAKTRLNEKDQEVEKEKSKQ